MRHLTISILLALLAWPAFGGVKKHETHPRKSTVTMHLDTSLVTGICEHAMRRHGVQWEDLTCADSLYGQTMVELRICAPEDPPETPLNLANCNANRIDSHKCVAPWNAATHPTLGKSFPAYAQCRKVAFAAIADWAERVGTNGLNKWTQRLYEDPATDAPGGVDGDEEP